MPCSPLASYLWQFVRALVPGEGRLCRLRRGAVPPFRSTLDGTFRSAAFRDQQGQQDQELLGIILKVLLRSIWGQKAQTDPVKEEREWDVQRARA